MVGWGGAAALLVAPLVAMQFTDEVRWTGLDFAVFGVLLGVALAVLELALRLSGDATYRLAFAVATGGAFLLTWVNLAVGIIGHEHRRANLVFLALLGIGAGGALLARFRPRGMSRTMMTMALLQVLVAAIVLALGQARSAAATALLTAPWLASAWLFRRAGLPAAER